MDGSVSLGEHHLVIESAAQMSDDAEFQCQVTPAGGDPPLVGTARLSVIGESSLQSSSSSSSSLLLRVASSWSQRIHGCPLYTHCVPKKVVHQTHGDNFSLFVMNFQKSFTPGKRSKFPTKHI